MIGLFLFSSKWFTIAIIWTPKCAKPNLRVFSCPTSQILKSLSNKVCWTCFWGTTLPQRICFPAYFWNGWCDICKFSHGVQSLCLTANIPFLLLCRLFSIIWFIEWVIVICSCISSIKIIQHMSSTRPKPHLKRHFSLDTDPVATLFLSFSHQDCHSTASAPEILAAMLSCPKRVPDGIEPSQMSQVIYQQLL